MTYIDKNYGPIILGDYIGHQEIYIDKQLNIMNGESSTSETFQQTEANGNNGTDSNTGRNGNTGTNNNAGTNDSAGTDSNTGRNENTGTNENAGINGKTKTDNTGRNSNTGRGHNAGTDNTGTNDNAETNSNTGRNENTGTNSKRPMTYRGKRIQHIFSKAEERELLSRVGDGYVWHENDTLLDYFLGRALCGDYPSEGDKPFWCFGEEGKVMPVNDMNRLFGRKNIGAIRRVRRMMPVPNGHELIDEVVDLTS